MGIYVPFKIAVVTVLTNMLFSASIQESEKALNSFLNFKNSKLVHKGLSPL